MAESQFPNSYLEHSKFLGPNSWPCSFSNYEENPKSNMNTEYENVHEDEFDSALCLSGSRLIKSGYISSQNTDNAVMFLNAGGGTVKKEGTCTIDVCGDSFFEGGDVLRTGESINDGGDMPSIYQSARFGNFTYRFNDFSPGDYLVDLHFAEIVNTNGPKGMRVFDVFIQGDKVLSELDIYSIVGANKPLQVVDIRVSVGEDRVIVIKFERVCGSPIVNGICIKRATELPVDKASQVKCDNLVCNNCAAEMEISSPQKKHMRMKFTAKYEKKIQELKNLCQLKTDECYEAWMSLTATNEQLEKVRMQLDNKFFQNTYLDQTLERQTAKLKDVSTKYKCDKRFWIASINELERKIKTMKEEHSHLSNKAHECADSIPQLNKMIFAVQALVAQCEDLKLKFNEEQAVRRKLHNQLEEAKGNIRVFCRCRPLSKGEASAGYATVVDFTAAKDGDIGILTGSSARKNFKFDRVYTPKDDQVDVFADASPMVTSVLDGYNVCIFAYGQTGTGKTFTMEGTEQNRGVNYRTLEQLFEIVDERKETYTYGIFVSVLEVYNEQIRDLLATAPTSKKLEIRQASEGFHHVPGIVEAKVENIKEVWNVLQAGNGARAVGSNNVNEHSSRSHCMLCILVRAKNLISGECTKSKLWLVDLAGSERLAKTDVQGERLKEAQNINRSLSALGDVISALATKSIHIPYRNSKLTHLLQDSLGGDSKTLMFVQISPSEQDLGETLSSLNFASRVRGVELGPVKKQVDTAELQKLKQMLDKAKQELRLKDEALRKSEENYHNLEGKAKGRDQLCKIQEEKLNELEDQLASKTELCRQLERQLLQLSERMMEKEEICSNFQLKVEVAENKLKEREQTVSLTLQRKVKELEGILKERTREFELHSGMLQQKVKELENKLKMEGESGGSLLHQQKVNELEQKLRQHQEEPMRPVHSAEKLLGTPIATPRTETISGMDPPSLRSLNCNSRTTNMGSDLLKGTDSLRELRRKKQVQSKGTENNLLLSSSLLDKKTLSAESNKTRQIDTSRALARITRSTKSVNTVGKALSSYKINRDQVTGLRESSSKLKMWLR
ncbi:PREDICTED: kinesin heavy chain isoform X1 [Theobroma cacao]|uniref:Kinesin heavy chain isoform X1 n=1 Tax=Theobroma cacao TaxID=3641 RepID=A0AB32WTE6_THECC|nr:PREDICTED: kinesin heavy chain isoform X1 [Theobroma cacao]